MKKLLSLLIVLCSFSLFAEQWTFTQDDLKDQGNWYSGITLLESLPLMEEVSSMTIQWGNKTIILEEEDLGEYWSEATITETPSTLILNFQDQEYCDLQSIIWEGTSMESRELELWLSWEGVEELKSEIQAFAEIHNLSIRAIEVPKPSSKLIAQVRARGDVPDLVMIQSSAVETLARTRAIQSLNYIKLPGITPQGIEAFTLDNRLWAVPFYLDTQVILYNKDLITPESSRRWSLDSMEDMAREGIEEDIHPMVWNAYSSNWLIPFQMAFGKRELIDRSGNISVNDEPTRKALEYIISLIDRELLVPMERDAMDALFIAGKVGMILTGSYAVPYMETLDLNFGILPYPRGGTTAGDLSPLLDYKAFCITKQTHAPILARRLLQYLSSQKVQSQFSTALYKLPAREDLIADLKEGNDTLALLANTVEYGTVIPPQNSYAIYKNTMWKLLRFALSGRMSVDNTLEQGQNLMNNSLNN